MVYKADRVYKAIHHVVCTTANRFPEVYCDNSYEVRHHPYISPKKTAAIAVYRPLPNIYIDAFHIRSGTLKLLDEQQSQ